MAWHGHGDVSAPLHPLHIDITHTRLDGSRRNVKRDSQYPSGRLCCPLRSRLSPRMHLLAPLQALIPGRPVSISQCALPLQSLPMHGGMPS